MPMKTLFINTCVRDDSRTLRLAEYYMKDLEGEITMIEPVKEGLKGLDGEMLRIRDQALNEKDYDHPVLKYARQFAEADRIIIAAPYWDLSFPAALKNYIERINCVGVTFDYDEQGRPYGMCRAEKLVYITTAGGYIIDDAYGYGYVKALCDSFYQIGTTEYYKAEGLDLPGADIEEILKKTEEQMTKNL